MSNIQLYKNYNEITRVTKNGEVIPVEKLDPVERSILETYANPTIRHISKQDLMLQLNDVISACYIDLGYKQPATDEDKMDHARDIWIMVQSITEELLSDSFYNSLRVNEVKKSVKKGSLGYYNTKDWNFIGISTVNIIKSIRGYLSIPNRSEEVSVFLKLTAPIDENKDPTSKEKFNLMASNAIKAFHLHKEGKDYSLFAMPVYDFLDCIKLIDFDVEEKNGFMEEAKRLLASETENKIHTSVTGLERQKFKQQLEGLIEGKDSEKQLIISRAKKLALKSFFDSVLFDDSDVSDIIRDLFPIFEEYDRNRASERTNTSD